MDAKKVEFIEKKFLDMVKLLDAHKHENRGHYKETIEKLNKETEEKKILQSKLIVIKEEYKKLLASTKRTLIKSGLAYSRGSICASFIGAN